MVKHRPSDVLDRAEVHISPADATLEVWYRWPRYRSQDPPANDVVEGCLRHGAPAEAALAKVAAAAWSHLQGQLTRSSPEVVSFNGGNYSTCGLRWKAVGVPQGYWSSLSVIVSFHDGLFSMAPYRFDVFLEPAVGVPGSSFEYDRSEQGSERVAARLKAMNSGLLELVAVLYGVDVLSVELTEPQWQKECSPHDAADAFVARGVVRCSEGTARIFDGQ